MLEAGAGAGVNLLVLSTLFPDVAFTGVEVTASGVARAKALAAADRLPEALLRLAPEGPLDPGAHRRVAFERGSGESLPFADGSFDLVFTRQALEQMEPIRDRAMHEVGRVSRSRVLMIEPFREANDVPLRRRYIIWQRYFQGALADLPR